MHKIKDIPILVIKAENDPIIGKYGIDDLKLSSIPNVVVGKTQYGGHMGYYEKFSNCKQFHNIPIVMFLNAYK